MSDRMSISDVNMPREQVTTISARQPPAPINIVDSGLEGTFIADLIMKHVVIMGEFNLPQLVDRIKLPFPIVNETVEVLQKGRFLEVMGASEYNRASYRFKATDMGRNYAGRLLELCHYAGPAPVTLAAYREMIKGNSVEVCALDESNFEEHLAHLTLSKKVLERLGPAANSGRVLFLYGPAGNGKTTIAEAIGRALPGLVLAPYAVLVGGEIVTVFDPVNHEALPLQPNSNHVDHRWVPIRRPVVKGGGELALTMLDLDFNPISKFYEAPLQMKANNGLFVVDDFGRQQVSPRRLLNRWIVPLERKIDFLTLHTGMKFEIPFDQLVIFATNIEPQELIDEAFLRRIRYKIKIDHPSESQYREIFRNACNTYQFDFSEEIYQHLLKDYYHKQGRQLTACHPRDLLEIILDYACYSGSSPQLTKESLANAWDSYFVKS